MRLATRSFTKDVSGLPPSPSGYIGLETPIGSEYGLNLELQLTPSPRYAWQSQP